MSLSCLLHAVRLVMTAALVVSAVACAATDAQALRTELVKPGLYRVDGAGGATLLRFTPDGVVVVDAKRAGMWGPLKAEIARIAKTADPPVRALILTGSGHEDAANASRFVDAGIHVIVQKRALAALSGGAAAASSPLVVSYDADHRLHSGGVVVEVEHVGRGRSGADSIVLFPDLRVVAVGELFTTEEPKPDCARGGSFAGWAAAITHLLYSDFEIAVPSRGPPVGKRELVALKAKLEAMAAERRACGG